MTNNQSEKIRLYSYWRSSCSYRVRIALHLKNIPFEYMSVQLLKKEQQKPSYKKLNPEGLVPCLQHGPYVITQSLAIFNYLEELYPRPELFPAPLKTKILSLCEIINSGIQPLHNLKVLQYLKSQTKIKNQNQWIHFWITQGLAGLEKQVQKQGKFAVGRALTAVDLFIVPQLYTAKRFQVDLNPFPRLLEIESLCLSLPAFKKAHPSVQPDAPSAGSTSK